MCTFKCKRDVNFFQQMYSTLWYEAGGRGLVSGCEAEGGQNGKFLGLTQLSGHD